MKIEDTMAELEDLVLKINNDLKKKGLNLRVSNPTCEVTIRAGQTWFRFDAGIAYIEKNSDWWSCNRKLSNHSIEVAKKSFIEHLHGALDLAIAHTREERIVAYPPSRGGQGTTVKRKTEVNDMYFDEDHKNGVPY